MVRRMIQLYELKDVLRVCPGVFIYSFNTIVKQEIVLDFYAKAHFKKMLVSAFVKATTSTAIWRLQSQSVWDFVDCLRLRTLHDRTLGLREICTLMRSIHLCYLSNKQLICLNIATWHSPLPALLHTYTPNRTVTTKCDAYRCQLQSAHTNTSKFRDINLQSAGFVEYRWLINTKMFPKCKL